VGAGFAGEYEFRVINIHCYDLSAHRSRDLHGEMPEAADAEDGYALTGLYFGGAEGAKNCDARAKKWRGFGGGKFFRNGDDVRGLGYHEFCVATIYGNSGDGAVLANIFAALDAIAACAAVPENPGHADARAS
jgi:hypothetical protein